MKKRRSSINNVDHMVPCADIGPIFSHRTECRFCCRSRTVMPSHQPKKRIVPTRQTPVLIHMTERESPHGSRSLRRVVRTSQRSCAPCPPLGSIPMGATMPRAVPHFPETTGVNEKIRYVCFMMLGFLQMTVAVETIIPRRERIGATHRAHYRPSPSCREHDGQECYRPSSPALQSFISRTHSDLST